MIIGLKMATNNNAKYIILLFVFLWLFFSPLMGRAGSNPVFLDFLTWTIYEDCRDFDLIISDDSLLDLRNSQVKYKSIDKKFLKQENYNIHLVRELIDIFDSRVPYGAFILAQGNKNLVGLTPNIEFEVGNEKRNVLLDGRNILRCGTHSLDINGANYYWDGEKMELPRNIYNENNYALFGFNIISNGGLTIFGFSIFSIFAISIFIIISVIKKILSDRK